MNKVLFILCSLFICNHLHATTFNGYIVTLKQDTLHGILIFNDENTFRFEDEFLLRNSVKAEVNGQILKFKAEDVLCYAVNLRGSWKIYYGVKTAEDVYTFMKKEVVGPLSLYSGMTYSDVIHKPTYYFLLQKKATNEFIYLQMNDSANSKSIIHFLSECEEVTGKMVKRELVPTKIPDWNVIANIYNESCGGS